MLNSKEKHSSFYRTLLLIAVLLLLATAVASLGAAPAAGPMRPVASGDFQSYIVVMEGLPLVAYEGDVGGLPATKPAKGKKFNANSAAVKKYDSYLRQNQNKALRDAGVSKQAQTNAYTVALNGFSAVMTAEQAEEMARQDGVTLVMKDQWRQVHTDNTPAFLKLTDPAGPWQTGVDGEGVIVGVIDTGIWPEHPSFADDGSYPPAPVLDDSRPNCEFGNTAHNPADVPFTCNNKLIGARQMLDTYRFFIGAEANEFDSARDDDGHGTHTASTSAGNAGIEASIYGIPRGTVSGIAPRAHVIAYKGLGELGGFTSDLAAAIDQAVADGVDVINYSVGGGASLTGGDEIAFLFAADAGVFVATSAGNSGPGPATIGGPASAPWLTSVGASSQSRAFISDITLSGPDTPPSGLWGGSVTTGVEDFNLVDADSVAGGTNGECLSAFPPGTFQADDAVLCNRYNFGTARTQRVANVAAGGGGAVIFQNVSSIHPNMTPTDNHPLPTVHMLYDVGQPLKDYLVANPGQVTVSFSQSESRYYEDDPRAVPNVMASFSSRGPNPVAEDIIKPDVTAPGINILAGASPIHVGSAAQGELFQSIMGTSMSSPHVAGIFALIKQAHPEWSPAVAKSALMTTAYQDVLKNDYVTPADPFDMGAGHVDPGGKANKGSVFEPGLAYDAGFLDYLGFLCDEGPEAFADPAATCGFLESIGVPTEAQNLNLPSIGVAELVGSQTVQRTVTSVAKENGWRDYTVSVDAPDGYEVSVSPSSFRLKSGMSATYEVTISNLSAPVGEWRFGSLTWSDKTGHYDVYSPVAVKAALFSAPAEVSGAGTVGSTSFDVTFGYTGSYAAAPHGLVADDPTSGEIGQDPDQTYPSSDDSPIGVQKISFPITGAAFVRWEMVIPGPDDIDLFLEDSSGNIIAASTNGGTDEFIELTLPADDTYTMVVHGWSVPNAPLPYTLHYWNVPLASGGSLSVDAAPASAVIGEIGTIDISWTLAFTETWPYLGAVSHTGDVGLMGLSLVEIDASTAVPGPD